MSRALDLDVTLPLDQQKGDRLHRRMLLFVLVGAAAWSLIAFSIVPQLIRAGYEERSLSIINQVFDHRHEHSLDFYMNKWSKLGGLALVAWLGAGFLVLLFDSRAFARRLVPPATPGALGAIRFWVCVILIYYAAFYDNLSTIARLPREMRIPMGTMDFVWGLPAFQALASSETALVGLRVVATVLLILGALGLWTRLVLPLAAISMFLIEGLVRSYAWFFHNGLIPLYLLIILCFLPSGDGFSLDRLLRIWKGKPVPPRDQANYRYGWSRYVLWMAVALPYVEAGMSKFRNGGWYWWHSTNMRSMLSLDSLKPNADGTTTWTLMFSHLPDWFFSMLGLTAVLGEIAMGLVLIFWTARMIMPALTVMMHVGIHFFQAILFLDLILLQAIFYNWRAVRQWVGRKLANRWGRIDVVIDTRSPVGSRLWQILPGLDLFERLQLHEAGKTEIGRFDPAASGDLIVLMHGHVYRDATALNKLAWSMPALWLIAPLMQMLPMSQMLWRRQAQKFVLDPTYEAPAVRFRFFRPVVMTLLVLVLAGAWVKQLEFFPFTAMQMYSKTTHSTVIHRYMVFAVDESGNTWPADLGQIMKQGRYKDVLANGFVSAKKREICEKFMLACANHYNSTAEPGGKIVKLKLEKWEWDFKNSDSEKRMDRIVDVLVLDVPTKMQLAGS